MQCEEAYSGGIIACMMGGYSMTSRTAKTRMITMQEVSDFGCTTTYRSCPLWLSNYTYKSVDGTVIDNTVDANGNQNYGYWSMSEYSERDYFAWRVSSGNQIVTAITSDKNYGARAVVEINK